MERERVTNDHQRASRIAEILLASQVRVQLVRAAQQCVYDRESAEDVVAVLVEKVARTYPDEFVTREQVLAFAFKAARTVSLDEIRRRRSDKRGGAAHRVPFIDEEVGAIQPNWYAMDRDWVEALLSHLPEDLQEVGRRHVFDGLDITCSIRAALGDLDEKIMATTRARWYHHVRKLQQIAASK